jgi:predicted metal-dependent phosphoesterase TrpH
VSQVDLHVHSTASDGRYSPAEIVSRAAAAGLKVIALTDHDATDGIPLALEAARAFPQLRVIPGVEISTDLADGEAHILGYFIDYKSQGLKSALERFRSSRQKRAQGMIDRLRDLNVHIEWGRVKEIAGEGSVGRPHIAQAMLEKGYINSIADAFNGYIENGGPAYVEREKMTPAEAVALVRRSDGLPVLAHPFTVNDPEAMVTELKAAGLAGIEAYYKDYSEEEVGRLLDLAGRHGLIATGGSDYHGLDESDEVGLGGADVPPEAAARLVALAEERGLRTDS